MLLGWYGTAGVPDGIGYEFGDQQFRGVCCVNADSPAGIQELPDVRRAQNGEVGSAASANVPASIALGSSGRRRAQAEPGAARVAACLLS